MIAPSPMTLSVKLLADRWNLPNYEVRKVCSSTSAPASRGMLSFLSRLPAVLSLMLPYYRVVFYIHIIIHLTDLISVTIHVLVFVSSFLPLLLPVNTHIRHSACTDQQHLWLWLSTRSLRLKSTDSSEGLRFGDSRLGYRNVCSRGWGGLAFTFFFFPCFLAPLAESTSHVTADLIFCHGWGIENKNRGKASEGNLPWVNPHIHTHTHRGPPDWAL